MNTVERMRTCVVAIAICVAGNAVAGESHEQPHGKPRKCAAAAKECEKQIREMLNGKQYLGLQLVSVRGGIVVKTVVPESPADEAGFRRGDWISSVNGRDCSSGMTPAQVKELFKSAKGSGTVSAVVRRGGETLDIEAKLKALTRKQIDNIIAFHLRQLHAQRETERADPQQ